MTRPPLYHVWRDVRLPNEDGMRRGEVRGGGAEGGGGQVMPFVGQLRHENTKLDGPLAPHTPHSLCTLCRVRVECQWCHGTVRSRS